MEVRMKEVSHEKSGGFDLGLTLITGGVGALTALTSEKHEVVIEHEGEFGVGTGSTHSEARANAIRDLNE